MPQRSKENQKPPMASGVIRASNTTAAHHLYFGSKVITPSPTTVTAAAYTPSLKSYDQVEKCATATRPMAASAAAPEMMSFSHCCSIMPILTDLRISGNLTLSSGTLENAKEMPS